MSVWLAREQVLSEGDPFREILGTLNNDGDAKDNAWKKFIFYRRISQMPTSVQGRYLPQKLPKLNV